MIYGRFFAFVATQPCITSVKDNKRMIFNFKFTVLCVNESERKSESSSQSLTMFFSPLLHN